MNKEIQGIIIKDALNFLIEEKGYTQLQIAQKFQQLEINVSRSSISNLRKNNPEIGLQLIKRASNGLLKIMKRDFCLIFHEATNKFEKEPDCVPLTIPIENTFLNETEINNPSYIIHDGRIDVSEKVDLYNYAAFEIIEIGIRLKSFRSYFSSKRESAFLEPIFHKLENGVNFKCYVADANGNFLRRYIEDRTNENQMELDVLKDISEITNELSKLFSSINRDGYKGKMELYHYDHFPYYHASVADGATERGLLYISPYLYGVSRANAPVTQLYRKKNKILYKRYWQSVKAFINSKQVFQIV